MVFGVAAKSLGLFFVLALNAFYAEDPELPTFYLFWGYATFVNVSFCVSYAQFSVSSRYSISRAISTIIPILVLAFAAGLAFYDLFASLFVALVGFFFLNVTVDARLLSENRSSLYLASMTLKNLLGLLAIVLGLELIWVLALYLLGEVLKFVFYMVSMRDSVPNASVSPLNVRRFLRYSSYIMLLSALIVLDRTIVFWIDPLLVVDFELFYRVIDVVVTACSAWTVPAYITAMSNRQTDRLRHLRTSSVFYSWLGVAALVVVMILYFSLGIITPFNYSLSGTSLYLTVGAAIFMLPLMVEALFIRRQLGLVIAINDWRPYCQLLLVKFVIVGASIVVLGSKYLVFSIFLATIFVLFFENRYIKSTLRLRCEHGF